MPICRQRVSFPKTLGLSAMYADTSGTLRKYFHAVAGTAPELSRLGALELPRGHFMGPFKAG